ncbi:roundabout homolog 4 [Danio rerio]|uniref:Si:dkey-23a13.2 n=2 Tax=Danio rerio TaxID=7955 RepID=A0A140LG22_DANRE
MGSSALPLLLLLISILHSGLTEDGRDLPRPALTVTPDSAVFTGETVNLKCVIESDHSDWTYEWYKDSNCVTLQSDGHYTVNRDTLTIRGAAESDQGQYWCKGVLGWVSIQSSTVSLSVKDLPRSSVTVTPDSAVFTGGTVNLKCVIESDHSDWTYEWYKDRNSVKLQSDGHYTENRDTLTIRGAAESDQGQYWCKGQRSGRPNSSLSSSAVSLSVKALPTPTVTVGTSAAFTAETESSQSSSHVFLSVKDLKPMSELGSELGRNAAASLSSSSSSSSSLSSSSSSSPPPPGTPPLLVIGVSVGLSVFLLLLILLVLLLRHKKKGLYHVYDDVIKAENRNKGQSSLETLYVLN